jgi:hypothetical protein
MAANALVKYIPGIETNTRAIRENDTQSIEKKAKNEYKQSGKISPREECVPGYAVHTINPLNG